MRLSALLFGLAAAASVRAHSTVWGVWINGIDQGNGQNQYIRSPPSNYPVKDLNSNAVACNVNNRAVPKTLKVKAGDTVTFEWFHDLRDDEIIAASHKGPIVVYIAPTSSNGAGNVWVKLYQEGYNGNWAVDKLIATHGQHSIKIPNIAAGQYLLRPELITLHEADTAYSSNLFVVCIQIQVETSGSALPSGVAFPGTYKYSDPGLVFNLYESSPSSYVIPGPAVWSGSAGGSISQVGTAGQSPPSGGSGTVPQYQQCGGSGWSGATACVSGSNCVKITITSVNDVLAPMNSINLQTPENKVFATYRDASKLDELNQLASERSNAGRLELVQLDMNDDGSCKAAANEIQSKAGSIDVLIINAGINNHINSLLNQSIDNVSKLFSNNVLGPLRITQHFAPLLNTRRLSKVVFLTSYLGSISHGKNGITPAYGISKAALNMMGRKLAHELEPSNTAVVLIHPGWVQTDMGGPKAPITPVQSIGGMLKVIDKVDLKNSGEYWQWDGQKLPW
ncbi:glycoside hydrolase family 61 protein, partial [Rhizoctonia solani AG-3 Rhs1AP]